MNNKVLILDTETTGLDFEQDEILQLSIINGDGMVVFDGYFKPQHKTSWEDAMKVNGITPEFVADKPSIADMHETLQQIIGSAETIIGFNTQYDLGMLKSAGIVPNENATVHDVMRMFMKLKNRERFISLVRVAEHYGFIWEEDAHNSLGDIKATLFAYNKITEELNQ